MSNIPKDGELDYIEDDCPRDRGYMRLHFSESLLNLKLRYIVEEADFVSEVLRALDTCPEELHEALDHKFYWLKDLRGYRQAPLRTYSYTYKTMDKEILSDESVEKCRLLINKLRLLGGEDI